MARCLGRIRLESKAQRLFNPGTGCYLGRRVALQPPGVPIDLKAHIRHVPDFPKPGILFYDISTLLAHGAAWKETVNRLVTAITLSRATMRNIRQNLFFALVYNAAGIPIAAGLLYPFTGVLLSPVIAAAAMALSSLSVVGNANRLRTYRRPMA